MKTCMLFPVTSKPGDSMLIEHEETLLGVRHSTAGDNRDQAAADVPVTGKWMEKHGPCKRWNNEQETGDVN